MTVVFIAVLVTLWSFVDYTVDLVRSVRQAAAKAAGESGGSEAPEVGSENAGLPDS